MRVLVMGGTRFVGRHIVDVLLTRGHEVTLCNRGRSRPELFADVERIVADRDDDLSALSGRTWDVVLDTSAYVAEQVERLADALAGEPRLVLISTVSVYDDPPAGFREDATVVAPAGAGGDARTTYAARKVACERAARRLIPADRLLVVRPGFVVGPDDHTWRFPHWVQRVAAGGEVLAPAPRDHPLQVIDARDLAGFVAAALDLRASGDVHVAGPRRSFDEVLGCIAEVTRSSCTLTWVDQGWLADRDVRLPLAIPPGGPLGLMAADLSRATGLGLAHRPLRDTIADTLAWTRAPHVARPHAIAPDRDAEARLLAEWHRRPPAEHRS